MVKPWLACILVSLPFSGFVRPLPALGEELVVKVEDGRGSSETRTLTLPVVGCLRLGNLGNIHPSNKAPVGERLARWALHGTYDKKELVHTGPIVKEVTRSGGQLRVIFDSVGSGLASRDGQPLTWFEVAGTDQVYVPATATIDDDSVVVAAPGIALPEWVRFAWHETSEPNLMNIEGLPANSFVVKVVGTLRAP